MKKYVFPLLGIYLDFILIEAASTLIIYAAAAVVLQYIPIEWVTPVQMASSLILALILKYSGLSVGAWLLEEAKFERKQDTKIRQWPNLMLGTILILSGLKSMVRWMENDGLQPFFYMLDPTSIKIALIMVEGAALVVAGAMILKFMPWSKTVAGVLIIFGAARATFAFFVTPDQMRLTTIRALENRGREVREDLLDAMWPIASYSIAGIVLLMVVLLYLCRRRSVRLRSNEAVA
jgi:hypothetical protein